MTLGNLFLVFEKSSRIGMLPGGLWQINSTQEFARVMPQGCAPDSTFINEDEVNLIKWTDSESWKESLEWCWNLEHTSNKIQLNKILWLKQNLQNID